MGLQSRYYSIDAFDLEDATGGWGTTEKQYPANPQRTFQGFIQPISGDSSFKNNKYTEDSTHRLYTNDTSLLISTQIRKTGSTQRYNIVWVEQEDGITGFNKHNEILLEVIDV